MMKKIALCLLVLGVSNLFADTVSDTLQAKLNAIHTMSATFNQVVKAKKREVSHSSGTMALSRPGRFRWQTKQPMQQLVVADGQHLWIYDPDLEQVTVKKQEKSMSGTAALFLSGYDHSVASDFDVTMHNTGNKSYFDLYSKSNKATFQKVKLIFIGEVLTGLELYDQLGQRTDVTLTDVKNNPKLATTLFQFKTPKGVDVVSQ